MANPYIHWDQREERRRWARELLARYGGGFLRSTDDFYRPAIQKTPVFVEIRPESRQRSRRVVLESLGQQTLFS